MRRRKAAIEGGTNKIKAALEKGEPIKGLQGFFRCEDLDCYIPLTVEALEMSDNDCGVKLRCQIKGAIGSVLLSPCEVIDDKRAVLDAENRRAKTTAAEDDVHQVTRHSLITVRRAKLNDLIDSLAEADKATIREDIEAAGLTVPKLPDQKLREYLKAAVELKHGVENISIRGSY